ncbi:MAG: copper homeostasis protein CutC [Bacteroidetes bacterium]|nr:copper homeostasis protein CutC [Bacteroidota bacterium]
MHLEICCYNFVSVRIAHQQAVDAIELCSNPAEGGCTPSLALIEKTVEHTKIPLGVMVRPRGGNFVYDANDKVIMLRDIEHIKKTGARFIVAGALTHENEIDIEFTKRLVETSYPLMFRFHRAIDVVPNYLRSMSMLIESGVTSVLTSGGEQNAILGLTNLKEAKHYFGHSMQLVVAGGVRSNNALTFLQAGMHYLHSGAGTVSLSDSSKLRFNSMVSENSNQYTLCDGEEIRAIKDLLIQ